jgi:CheY-like chemotaxis protein
MRTRILVVDDQLFITETLRIILETRGYVVLCANSGIEAIAEAGTYSPHLLLSDVMMPGLNGFEAGLRIKERCPDCRLLFLSGYAKSPSMSVMTEGLKRRGYRFELLEKPIPPDVLLDKVKAALAEEP